MLREDLKYITTEYLRDTNQISVRTANCCISEGLDNFHKILLFFEENGSFFRKKIKNAGRKSCEELDALCLNIIPNIEKEEKHLFFEIAEVKSVIKELNELEREILFSILALIENMEKDIRKRAYILSNNNEDIFNYAFNFCIKNGYFPMFGVFRMYLNLDENRDTKMAIEVLPIFQDSESAKLDEVAERYEISRERVRQICNIDFCRTFEISSEVIEQKKNGCFLKYSELLQSKTNWDYILDMLKGIDVVSRETYELQNCLKKEQNTLSFEFVAQIIAYVFRDIFTIYGSRFNNTNKGENWKSTLLIRKAFTDIFDFDKMREEFENILIENEIEYLLDIENHISNSMCWKIFDYDKINSITKITKIILLYEFGLYSEEIYGQIKIPASKERKPIDVVYDILKQNEHPMHLMEIFSEFKRHLPKHKYTLENNPSKLRPSLHKHEDITFVNRKSVYTLKEWKHIPKGTIRNKIVEFLDKRDIPQSVESITEYVNLFFQTTQKNVHSSMHSGKYFVQFKGNLFGLKSKQYSSDFEKMKQSESQRKTFEQRLNDLELFIVENDHFPFSTSESDDETSLYRWWALIEQGRKKLSENQQKEVVRIQREYAEYKINKDTHKWNLTYNKIKVFILSNKRLPSAKGEEESLYTCLNKIKNDFYDDRLTEEQRRKYIELVKLI